jgi:hypothetical protein
VSSRSDKFCLRRLKLSFLVVLKRNVDGKPKCPFQYFIMKTKTIGLVLALCFFGTALCFAEDSWMGTWKLNEAKSKIPPGTMTVNIVIEEAVGDNVKISVDGTDKDGRSIHNEWIGKFDGKDYPVTGDPNSDMRSYKKVGDRTLEVALKKDGKVMVSGQNVLSADRKSLTVTMSGIDAEGKKVTNRAVYDKQ